MGTSPEPDAPGEQFDFWNQQQALAGTEYTVNTSNRFIHYTSLDVAFNILNQKEIRFYNLNNLNDGQELVYSAKEFALEVSKEQMEDLRRQIFVHSTCEYNNDNDDFNLWRLYGQNGSGVGIVYEISNLNDEWHEFFFGKVIYDSHSTASNTLRTFIEYHNNFLKKNDCFKNIPILIPTLLLFHKNPIWSIEKEYRLITLMDYEKFTLQVQGFPPLPTLIPENYLQFSYGSNKKVNAYVRFPLFPFDSLNKTSEEELDFKDSLLKTFPTIKISKIILGYNYTQTEYEEIRMLILQLSIKNFKNLIPVHQSSLATILY